MKKNYRKILFVLVIACFVLTATNIVLILHLAGHNKDEHHDHKNCPICQQIIINKKPAIFPSVIKIFETAEVRFAIIYENSAIKQIQQFQLPLSRAPPVNS